MNVDGDEETEASGYTTKNQWTGKWAQFMWSLMTIRAGVIRTKRVVKVLSLSSSAQEYIIASLNIFIMENAFLFWSYSLENECFSVLYSLWRRQWHPTPVLLLGKSHGWRSLVGYSPWGRKESQTTEQLHFQLILATHFGKCFYILTSGSVLLIPDSLSLCRCFWSRSLEDH